jgi:hypothetical protein
MERNFTILIGQKLRMDVSSTSYFNKVIKILLEVSKQPGSWSSTRYRAEIFTEGVSHQNQVSLKISAQKDYPNLCGKSIMREGIPSK